MKLKLAIIVLLSMLLVGCSSEVSFNINEDLSVDFEIKASETLAELNDIGADFFLTHEYVMDLKQKSVDYYKGLYPEFSYQLYNVDDVYYGVASRKFNYITDIKNSNFFQESFSEVNVTKKRDIVNVSLKELRSSYISDVYGNENEIVINVTLPYVVTSNNADKVDLINNVYSWIVNQNTEDIIFSFDSSKIYEYSEDGSDKMKDNKFNILVCSVIGGFVCFIGIVVGIKFLKNKNL